MGWAPSSRLEKTEQEKWSTLIIASVKLIIVFQNNVWMFPKRPGFALVIKSFIRPVSHQAIFNYAASALPKMSHSAFFFSWQMLFSQISHYIAFGRLLLWTTAHNTEPDISEVYPLSRSPASFRTVANDQVSLQIIGDDLSYTHPLS